MTAAGSLYSFIGRANELDLASRAKLVRFVAESVFKEEQSNWKSTMQSQNAQRCLKLFFNTAKGIESVALAKPGVYIGCSSENCFPSALLTQNSGNLGVEDMSVAAAVTDDNIVGLGGIRKNGSSVQVNGRFRDPAGNLFGCR